MVIVLTPLTDDQYSPFQHFLLGSEQKALVAPLFFMKTAHRQTRYPSKSSNVQTEHTHRHTQTIVITTPQTQWLPVNLQL